jgi:hypothetical protein
MSSVTLNLALETWLAAATAAAAASPACRAAAAVRQQLQEPRLQQHLGTAMDAAAARLTAVAATAPAAASTTGSSSSSSTTSPPEMGPDQLPMDKLSALEGCCESLLQTYHSVTCVLAPSVGILQAAFPAAPSALRLSLAILQTYDRLQAPWQQQEAAGAVGTMA